MTPSWGNGIKAQASPEWELHPLDSKLSLPQGLEGRRRHPHSNATSLAITITSHLHLASIQKQFVRSWVFPAHSVPGCSPAWDTGCPLEAPRGLHHILGKSHVPKTRKASPPSPRSHACGGGQQRWEARSEQDQFPQQPRRSPGKAVSKGTSRLCLSTQLCLQRPREKFIGAVCPGTEPGSGETWTVFHAARVKEKSSVSPQCRQRPAKMCRRYQQVPQCPAARPWCYQSGCRAFLDKTTCKRARGLEKGKEKKKRKRNKKPQTQPLGSKGTFHEARPWSVAELNEILRTSRGSRCPGSVIPCQTRKGGTAQEARKPPCNGISRAFLPVRLCQQERRIFLLCLGHTHIHRGAASTEAPSPCAPSLPGAGIAPLLWSPGTTTWS